MKMEAIKKTPNKKGQLFLEYIVLFKGMFEISLRFSMNE